MADEVAACAGLDRTVEVGDRRAALGSQRRLARAEEAIPVGAVDPRLLRRRDVAREPVRLGPRREALADRRLLLRQEAEPERDGASAVADVDRPSGDRRGLDVQEIVGDVPRQRGQRAHPRHQRAVDLRDLVLGHAGEEDVDAEVTHHRRDRVDPAVLVLDELDLQAPVARDLLAQHSGQIALEDDDDRVVHDDGVELVEVEEGGRVGAIDRVERVDVVLGEVGERADVVCDVAGLVARRPAEQEHRFAAAHP